MNHRYADILDLIAEPPKWWDEYAVPRYCEFNPRDAANIYADECVLLLIECQDCAKEYEVCITWTKYRTHETGRALASYVKDAEIHYGDPPNNCGEGCYAGATMNSVPRRVLQFWKRDLSAFEWRRVPELEIEVTPEWAEQE